MAEIEEDIVNSGLKSTEQDGQELHASPHIEHTPHIVLSIIWNVLSIYGYVAIMKF